MQIRRKIAKKIFTRALSMSSRRFSNYHVYVYRYTAITRINEYDYSMYRFTVKSGKILRILIWRDLTRLSHICRLELASYQSALSRIINSSS